MPAKKSVVDSDAAVEMFKLLGSKTNLVAILLLDETGEKHLGDVSKKTGTLESNTSKVMKLMRLNGIVTARQEGKRVYFGLTPKGQGLASAARVFAENRGA